MAMINNQAYQTSQSQSRITQQQEQQLFKIRHSIYINQRFETFCLVHTDDTVSIPPVTRPPMLKLTDVFQQRTEAMETAIEMTTQDLGAIADMW